MKKLESKLWARKAYVPREGVSVDVAVREMLRLWDGYHAENVFKVCWLVETQLREMREAGWTVASARKELCDIVFICVREMAALGFDPGEIMLERLGIRHRGQIDEIYEKYERMFQEEFGATLEALEESMREKDG